MGFHSYPVYIVCTSKSYTRNPGGRTYKYRGGYWTTYTYELVGQVIFKDRVGRGGTSRTNERDNLRYEGSDSFTSGESHIRSNSLFRTRDLNTFGALKTQL